MEVFSTTVPSGYTETSNQILWIEHKLVKNPKWWHADQLAIFKEWRSWIRGQQINHAIVSKASRNNWALNGLLTLNKAISLNQSRLYYYVQVGLVKVTRTDPECSEILRNSEILERILPQEMGMRPPPLLPRPMDSLLVIASDDTTCDIVSVRFTFLACWSSQNRQAFLQHTHLCQYTLMDPRYPRSTHESIYT